MAQIDYYGDHEELTYTVPAWWGFANFAERNRVEAFMCQAIKNGYCAHSTPPVAHLYDQADQQLFATVTQNNAHPLQQLLPVAAVKHAN